MRSDFQPGDVVIWWRRAAGEFVFPVRATILGVTPKRVKIEAVEPEEDARPIIRYVAAESLQRIGMYYRKATGQGPYMLEPACSWGTYTRYLEIAEDLYASRHVDVFENGYSLRYDRLHWVDDCGMLADALYCARSWGPAIGIGPAEFEEVWRAAENSPARQLQLASARMSDCGEVPAWLTIKRTRFAPLSKAD
jgi:hypothetical protein